MKHMKNKDRDRPLVPSASSAPGYGSDQTRSRRKGAKVIPGLRQATKIYELKLATFNTRSISSETRLTELEYELKKIKWDILGISEVRKQGEELITTENKNILYYKGNDDDTHAGVGFIIKKNLEPDIIKIVGLSGRVAYVILNINRRYKLKIIQLYAPTSTSTEEDIELFYDDVNKSLEQDRAYYNIIIGDLNAKVGKRLDPQEACMGDFGIGERNDRGHLLINFLLQNNMYVMNTFFNKKVQNKWTWRSPDGSTKNEIDFVITNKKSIINDVSVLNQFATSSDHRLVRTSIRIDTKKERMKLINSSKAGCLETEILKTQDYKYQTQVNRELNNLTYDELSHMSLNKLNRKIIETLTTATKEIRATKKNTNEKLSEDTKRLLNNRRQLRQEGRWDTTEYAELNRRIKKEIREDIRNYNENLTKKIIEENSNMKILKTKLVTGKKHIIKMKRTDGTVATEEESILEVAKEFYTKLYKSNLQNVQNRQETKRERTIRNVGSEEIPEITMNELRNALKQTKNRKAPGRDSIINEHIKNGGRSLLQTLKVLFNKCLDEGDIPDDWNEAIIILIHKKGDKTEIANYRPISLLSHLYKLFIKIIANRLGKKLDEYQPIEQAGFRKGFGTNDHLQTLKQLIEKSNEYNLPLAMAFIDYEKAFDTIEIMTVLNALDDARIDTRYSTIIKNIYKKATSVIKLKRTSDKIKIERGVRQGDTLSPKLFTLALENIFKTIDWSGMGINVDGKHLTHLRYADDIIIIAKTEEELQLMIKQLQDQSKEVGLNINKKKTKILSNLDEHLNIMLDEEQVERVESYVYLGHNIKIGKENQEAEINRRVALGWAAFNKLSFVLRSKTFPTPLKTKIFDKCILPVLTYGAETMSLTHKIMHKLAITQRAMERRMLGVTLRDRKRNEWLRDKTKIKDIVERVAEQKWSWAGHIVRAEDRWTNRLLYWQPRTSKRKVGRPPKRWEDDIKETAGRGWRRLARDRENWIEKGEDYVQNWILKV